MGGDTYTVRVAASIAKRGEGATRRRAGLTFGGQDTLVTTTEGVEGAVLVTEGQLAAILEDSNLRAGDSPYPEPGLRVKEVTQDKDAIADHRPEAAILDPDLRNPTEAHAQTEGRQPGRPRKAAKE